MQELPLYSRHLSFIFDFLESILQEAHFLDLCPLLRSKGNSLLQERQIKLSPLILASSGILLLKPQGEQTKHLLRLDKFLPFPSIFK